jgi:hypothetical protein
MASEMLSGCDLEMGSGIVTEKVSDLAMTSEMPSEGKLIGHVCFEEIQIVCLVPLLLSLLCLFDSDVIAVLAEC